MELTKREEELLKEFNSYSYNQLEDLFKKNSNSPSVLFWDMLDHSLEMSASVFANLPHKGIAEDRARRLIFAQTNSLKKKYRQLYNTL